MRLDSHVTAGARRRLRHHCAEHRPLAYRGRHGDDLVFEAHATDGRTYIVRVDAGDRRALREALGTASDGELLAPSEGRVRDG